MKKIIIDCDPGIDDSIALMLTLASDELELLGITTVSGNIEVNGATENTFHVLDLMDRKDIPVYKGAAVPLKRPFHDATDTHGSDGMGGINLAPTGLKAQPKAAADFIVETLRKYPGEITLVALGPLTNIAAALEKDPEAMKLAADFILMGGADRFHGNCSPVAEFNFWVDAEAADIVFKSGFAAVRMVGLDVTHDVIMSPNLREVALQIGGKRGRYIHDITRFYVDFHWAQERTLGCVINDPLVIAELLEPGLVRFDPAYVEMETEGPADAQSVCDPDGMRHEGKINACIGHSVDAKHFFEILFSKLFPDCESDIKLSLDREFGAGKEGTV